MPSPRSSPSDKTERRRGHASSIGAVEVHDGFDAVRDVWTALSADQPSVFATPDWNEIWWQEREGSGRLRIVLERDADGRPRVIVPFLVHGRRPARLAQLLAYDAADELGPVHRPGDGLHAVDVLRRALPTLSVSLALVERVSLRDPHLVEHLGGRELRREASPVVALDRFDDWDALLRSKSRGFREQARRRERRLLRDHEASFRLVSTPAELASALDALFALHRARWEGSETTFSRLEGFHRAFAARALERGWLRLWQLEVEGSTRAALLGYRLGGVEAYYQSGRDPGWSELSLGTVLLNHAIREALADGMTEYRLLRGDEPYKYRIATSDPGIATFAVGVGASGAVAERCAALAARSRRLRRIVQGVR